MRLKSHFLYVPQHKRSAALQFQFPLVRLHTSFDQDTQDWVNTRNEMPYEDIITGNVTRFNSITRNGRIYVDQLQKVVPFKLDVDFPIVTVGLLTWSLHGSNTDLPKKLELKARHVRSAHGLTKRILLAECKRIEEDL
ncbi:MAG: hypothetical protein P8O77_03850 [Emcibacteraceae bacterium]|nr:hypothetical protein [Emcibacteraceae bacterium]MDG1020605.1 hypothetical protein [Emcibacteraceae bacterium]